MEQKRLWAVLKFSLNKDEWNWSLNHNLTQTLRFDRSESRPCFFFFSTSLMSKPWLTVAEQRAAQPRCGALSVARAESICCSHLTRLGLGLYFRSKTGCLLFCQLGGRALLERHWKGVTSYGLYLRSSEWEHVVMPFIRICILWLSIFIQLCLQRLKRKKN